MANLSWNEVRDRAIAFSRRWTGEAGEAGGAQTFWNEFFAVFGRDRRTVAAFEVAVRNLRGEYSYIDLLWRGILLVEQKSRGRSLNAAESQAFAYIEDLARENRFEEIPRYVIVSDFANVALYDLEPAEQKDLPLFAGRSYDLKTFPLTELHRNIRHFGFIKGERSLRLDPEDPANEKAYDRMCELHDELARLGFVGTDLERVLVRVLFCLFADDTGVFEPATFETFIKETRDDGSDVGARLNELFAILDTPEERWSNPAKETFAGFRYINGDLFKGQLRFPPFTRVTRAALLAACEFQWARVSPAVFGSLFQGIMDDQTRRQQGAHYTSERDIMKVIRSLFLDDLAEEFETIRSDGSTRRKTRLENFHTRLRSLRFLDPACGCGNFLALGYREVRKLELKVLTEIHITQQFLDIRQAILVDVDQFFGIEYGEWPARIAEVAMWLMDHQMNQLFSETLGQSFERLPLRASPHIVQQNALRLDWGTVVSPREGLYVLGNPPFVGKHYQNAAQKADMAVVFGDFKNLGDIDYVVSWFKKAAEYIQGTQTKVAFVSTNSVTQGEQVPIVWGMLFDLHIKIHFAHRTFAWMSEARGKAHVHVVIIGFGAFDTDYKYIVDYEPDPTHPTKRRAANISPYLTPGPDAFVTKRTKPLADVPDMRCGNKPSDGGNLILTDQEKDALVAAEPGALKFLRRYTGAEEFINGNMRWCLWLVNAKPAELRNLPQVMERVEKVREFREHSTAEPTRRAARTPTKFFYINQPPNDYIVVPEVSSERRRYVPMGIAPPELVSANTNFLLPTDDRYIFGILTSAMHMAWLRIVGGRLKSDLRYSGSMVYNTFPWPGTSNAKQMKAVVNGAEAVLEARAPFLPPLGTGSLADLYDPLTMPPELTAAHTKLDRAVDRCYRSALFESNSERIEHLFQLYDLFTAPLLRSRSASRKQGRKLKQPARTRSLSLVGNTDDSPYEEDSLQNHSGLPKWYLDAFDPHATEEKRGEVVMDSLDVIYDHIDDMLASGRAEECDAFLAAVANEPERSSLSALVGVLTVTLPVKGLTNRARLREIVRQRLLAAGQNADAVLKGL